MITSPTKSKHLSYVDTEALYVLLGIEIDANEETEDNRSLKPVSMQKVQVEVKTCDSETDSSTSSSTSSNSPNDNKVTDAAIHYL